MESFAKKVRDQLASAEPKKKCCRRMLDAGMSFDETVELSELAKAAKCPSCTSHLAAGLFISHGSVTDPAKRYHLDLKFTSEKTAADAAALLTECSLAPKTGKRGDASIVYFKDSGAIEDFLAFVGATGAAFDVMNSKIVKELRNSANRAVNCDTANIRKSLEASAKQLEMVNAMIENGMIEKLPKPLRETALLRSKYDQLTIAELGAKHDPPITKSGVKHRLEKITEIYTAGQAADAAASGGRK